MTQAVVSRRDGDTFQARVFWLPVAGLAPAELMVALIFVGSNQQIYWATKVPLTMVPSGR